MVLVLLIVDEVKLVLERLVTKEDTRKITEKETRRDGGSMVVARARGKAGRGLYTVQ